MIYTADSISGHELSFVNLRLREAKIGTGTDLNGIGKISLPMRVLYDTLICSYVGYTTKSIVLRPPILDTISIGLVPTAIQLDKVIVSGQRELLRADKLIRVVLKKIKENYKNSATLHRTFYSEKLYENEQLIEINESININFYTRYPQKKYVNKSWRAYWTKEFRLKYKPETHGRLLYIGVPQFFKYYNTVADKCYVETSRLSDNHSVHAELESFIGGGPLALTALDKVKYLSDFLDLKLVSSYKYYRKGVALIDSIECLAIGFKPLVVLKQVSHPWSQKLKFPIYSGTIYVSKEDLAVVRVQCQFAENNRTDFYRIREPWQIFPSAFDAEITYRMDDSGRWIVRKIRTVQDIRENSSSKWEILEDYRCVRELFFLDAVDEKCVKDERSLLKDIEGASLRRFPVRYDEDRWEDFEKEPNFPKVISTHWEAVENKSKLIEQFRKNGAVLHKD